MDGGELIVCFVFVWLCCDASYKQGKQPSGSSPSFLCSTRITPPFLPCLNAVPTRRLSLSLSLSPWHSDIPTFYGIMSKIGEPKVRFLSLSLIQTTSSGFLLAESALFTLPWLLFAADGGGLRRSIPFFFLSTRFASMLNRFRSLSPAFLIKRAFSGSRGTPNVEGGAAESIAGNVLVLLLFAWSSPSSL